MKKRKQKKSRFINLAEQLTLQNDVVSTTMDSLLGFVSDDEDVENRSDFDQIQKTADQLGELNPSVDIIEHAEADFRRPRINRISDSSPGKALQGPGK